MKKNKIIIHQAYYGEANRAHSCIQQTLDDDDLTSFLTSFTDRPAALPTGSHLVPYLSGSSCLSKYYIFTKTFSDNTASRAGMVLSHVLILELSDIEKINDLNSILKQFIKEIPIIKKELKPLQIELSNHHDQAKKVEQPKYIQQVISSYLTGARPLLFSGRILSFIKALQIIWNSPEIQHRRNVKFRVSFTPSDIADNTDLSIVSIQNDFLAKWQGQEIIDDANSDTIEITEPSELLFLGIKEGNDFYNFLISLNVDLKQIANFRQYGTLFQDYVKIDKLENGDQLRQDIRLLSKISPSSKDGILIKNKFVNRLKCLIESKKDSNIKALKNIEWSSFKNGLEGVSSIVSNSIATEIANLNKNRINQISEIIDISLNDSPKNWWHDTVTKKINSEFQKNDTLNQPHFWKLFENSTETLKNLFLIIKRNKSTENILLRHLPTELNEPTCEKLLQISEKNNWYLLHANLLLKKYSLPESINKQLTLEKQIPLEDSVGFHFLKKKLSKKQLLKISIETNDHKLISALIDAIIKDPRLMDSFNPKSNSWFKTWEGVTLKTNNIFQGLAGREEEITFATLDRLLDSKKVDKRIIELISVTTYANISNYKKRSLIWEKLPYPTKSNFVSSTTNSLIDQLLSDKVDVGSLELEYEIKKSIVSDSVIGPFLNKHRNDIKPVLKIYEILDELKDSSLSDYIKCYTGTMSENQSKKLGKLVLNRKFKNSAKEISEKAKYQNSFKPAHKECESLVQVFSPITSFLNTLFGSSSNSYNTIPIMDDNLRINTLPTVIILTALKEEYNAIREHLIDISDADHDSTTYEVGLFKYMDKNVANVIIRECGAKNSIASQETERAIQIFKPDSMFFVGIAGSRKPNDFTIGDVIFPEKVYSYEGGKSEKDSFVSRPDTAMMSYALIETAKKERRKDDWKSLIKNNQARNVKADLGIIASGEQVVEHFDSDVGKILSKHFNDTSVVEMEGFGFAKALNRQGSNTNILIGIVRGISDVIGKSSNDKGDNTEDRRPADAKEIASATAAAFTFWLILKTYT